MQQAAQDQAAMNRATQGLGAIGPGAIGPGAIGPGQWHNAQQYKTAKKVTPIVITPTSEEAYVDEFMVGTIPSEYVYPDLDCFRWFDDLPEKYAEGAKLLHASLTGEEYQGERIKIKGLGSIRVIRPGELFYIRLCL
jgi:hypothetical protein